jgi:peptidoglycan L-alanyl-D-glutamate endopeptidase CwlK
VINSRSIDALTPKTADLCKKFIATCKTSGIDIIITSTYRDDEQQDELYAQGRTKAGHIVTNAKAGDSFHNYKMAFDFVPIVNGKADYTHESTFLKCGIIAESIGLEWAGRWAHFKELAHCQLQNITLAELKKNKSDIS